MQSVDYNPTKQLFLELRQIKESSQGAFSRIELPVGVTSPLGSIKAFYSPDATVGLLIPMSEQTVKSFKPDLSGKSITLNYERNGERHFALLTLKNLNLQSIFEVFCDHVLKESSEKPETAALTTQSLLKHWKSLFTGTGKQQLSQEQLVGIIAELETLELLLTQYGGEAFHRWTGPDKNRHDFCFDDRSVESKATTVQNGLFIIINGHHQLTPVPNLPLELHVRKYEQTPSGELTLSATVDRLIQNPLIPELEFLDRLSNIGYTHAQVDDPSESKFRLIEKHIFSINDEFPRLTNPNKSDRIQNVKYTIDLSSPENIPGHQKA